MGVVSWSRCNQGKFALWFLLLTKGIASTTDGWQCLVIPRKNLMWFRSILSKGTMSRSGGWGRGISELCTRRAIEGAGLVNQQAGSLSAMSVAPGSEAVC
jgi:hypothetical protein